MYYLPESLDCKEIKAVHPKGTQSWIFIGRTDAEAKALILWQPDSKSGLIVKDWDAGKEWRQEEKGMTENEMIGWHHWLCGHEFEQSSEDSEGQGSLKCFSPWGGKESDMTEWLNNKLSMAFAIYEEGYPFNLHQILSKVGEKPQSMI